MRLNQLGEIVGGGTPKTDNDANWLNGKIAWITPADMKNVKGKYISKGERNITLEGLNSSSTKILSKSSIVYSSRAPIGYIAITNNALCTNQGFKSIDLYNKSVVDYLYYGLIYFTPLIQSRASGTTFKEISGTEFGKIIIPLPPLSEQKRIVAKIEELLPFIEQYAKKEQELTALHQAFPEQLKKSILQAAIQGKLTEQHPNDEPAVELIKRIQAEKERLILEKKIKKPKQRSEIIVRDNSHYEIVDGVERCIDDEIPFEIPESWCWVRLKDITYQLGQEIPKSTFCYIDVGLIDNNLHRISNNQNIIEPNDAPSRARKIVQKGTILYSTVRPYLKNICILEEDFPYTPIASTAFATMETFQDIDRKFLFYYLLSPTFTDFVNQAMVGVAYPAINDENLYKIVVPIPPLEEQQRIVSKIEQLFSYLENLPK